MFRHFSYIRGLLTILFYVGLTINVHAQNLVVNSNFAQVDNVNCKTVGFSSYMTLDCAPPSNGHDYFYVTNTGVGWNGPYWTGVKDHTPGDTTNFLMGDGGNHTTAVWKQSINVKAGSKYSFSAWFINANVNGRFTGNTSQFEVWVKGSKNEKILETGLIGKITPWTEYTGTYNAVATETIELSIVNLETVQGGNDFAIDDISFVSETPDSCRRSSVTSLDICLHDSIQVVAGEGWNYKWQSKSINIQDTVRSLSISPNSNTLYIVKYVGVDTCLHTDSFEIKVHSLPIIELPVDQLVMCQADSGSVQLNWSPSNYEKIEWNPSHGISDKNIPNPHFKPTKNTKFEVLVEDSNGCVAFDSFAFLRINCDCKIVLPNAFSPNLDDLNDQFKPIYSDCNLINMNVRIYNRWGELLWKSDDKDASWDGRYRGENAPNGVYFWILGFSANVNGFNQSEVRSGTITLLR